MCVMIDEEATGDEARFTRTSKAVPYGAASISPRLAGRRILVVEDSEAIAEILTAVLEAAGAAVVGPAPRLAAALAMAESADIDIASLDIDLDGTMVWPAADRLARRGIPFLFATGQDTALMVPPRFHDRPVLTKPFTIRAMQAALTQLLETEQTRP